MDYQIYVRLAGVIEFGDDVSELAKDLVVTGHVGRQDAPYDALAHYSVRRIVQGREDVALGRLQDPKCHGAMMILQRRDIVVAQRQLGPRVYLIDIVVARMVEIVADARDNQYEDLEVADFRRKIHRPGYRVHLDRESVSIKPITRFDLPAIKSTAPRM